MKKVKDEYRRIQEALTSDQALDEKASFMSPFFAHKNQRGQEVVADISTFINSSAVLDGQLGLDAWCLHDLDVFVDSTVLHDVTCVLQPFDARYSDMADLEWLDKSSTAKSLYDRGILQARPVRGYSVVSWKATEEFFKKTKIVRDLEAKLTEGLPVCEKKDRLDRTTWGVGRRIHSYNQTYIQIYSPWVYWIRTSAGVLGRRPDRTALAFLIYRTNECIEYARSRGLPYHPHSLKVPIVSMEIKQNEIRLRDLVDSLARIVENRESKKPLDSNPF